MAAQLQTYLRQIAETTQRGDAREESYYSFLKSLIEEEGGRRIAVTILPKRTDAGNPDFRVWDGRQHITGYIEAKTPGTNLDQIETSEQLQRYLSVFPNLILTDFYEFRLYREGRLTVKASIGRPFIASRLHHLPPLENEPALHDLLSQFFAFSLPRTFTAESLAVELAKRTRFLRDEVIAEEMREEQSGRGEIRGFYHAFQRYLLPDLDESQFADLYAQTLVYGMFAARSRSGEDFTRQSAFNHIPGTIGILRDVFRFISLGELPVQMEVIIDDIADVLAAADLERILHQFDRAGRGRDPIVHFYETFLSAYDPALREQRGVYYTPEPVVKYIVRSIHEILKQEFHLADGLADPAVTLLDPAAGTLTFPVEAIRLAVEEHTRKYGSGDTARFLKEQILQNYYAFELMMAPYAVSHLKAGFLMDELGYPMEGDERFQLYLTNTLSMEDLYLSDIPGLSSLSEESHEAAQVKQKPILVILGNPPYSGISANQSDWTERLLKTDMDGAQSYYTVDGQPLGEKKVLLQDDYVKFLRFAQWKVQRAGEGVVGMITNHGYLDNPTFRGMRQSLMKTFNQITVLNLHGSSLKKEKAPDGGKDENVFDIRTGVAIVLLVKKRGAEGCTVKQADLYGTRESKYDWLEEHQLSSTDFKETRAATPWYFFTANGLDALGEYSSWERIDQIFPRNSVGIVTGRDDLTINFNRHDLWVKILNFSRLDTETARMAYQLGKDSRDWQVALAQKDLKDSGPTEEKIFPILYRPFDPRFTYFTARSRGFQCMPRGEVMRNMIQGRNIGIVAVRQVKSESGWKHVLISDTITESCYISNRTSEIDYLFPLFLYSTSPDGGLLGSSFTEPTPNLDAALVARLSAAYGRRPSPEEILYYIYGVFYSNLYREKYAEALRIDFPRVPFTREVEVFTSMSALGKRLADLHLLKSAELDPPIARYQGSGAQDTIEKVEYDEAAARVRINDAKYFEGIPPEVWNYQIGGYQVLNKYLKDRKGRRMDDPVRYVRIATALARTIEIQKEIDALYPSVEESIL